MKLLGYAGTCQLSPPLLIVYRRYDAACSSTQTVLHAILFLLLSLGITMAWCCLRSPAGGDHWMEPMCVMHSVKLYRLYIKNTLLRLFCYPSMYVNSVENLIPFNN